MKSLRITFVDWINSELQKQAVILLPLRLFIGLGWLRSSVEKLSDPEWYSGVALHHFFFERIADGDVAFPFYQLLMEGPFSAHAPLLSKLIMVGEFYCGVAILVGLFARPALLAGLFMNLNFILAGSINPSAFYIVIQLTLLFSAAGSVFGVGSLLAPNNLFSDISPRRMWIIEKTKMRLCFCGALLCGLLALLMASQVQHIDPAQSVEDPAMLLLILCALHSLMLLLLGGRSMSRVRELRDSTNKEILNKVAQSVRQNPIPEYIPQRAYGGWAHVVGVEQSL